jgi:hypothetical protein
VCWRAGDRSCRGELRHAHWSAQDPA